MIWSLVQDVSGSALSSGSAFGSGSFALGSGGLLLGELDDDDELAAAAGAGFASSVRFFSHSLTSSMLIASAADTLESLLLNPCLYRCSLSSSFALLCTYLAVVLPSSLDFS